MLVIPNEYECPFRCIKVLKERKKPKEEKCQNKKLKPERSQQEVHKTFKEKESKDLL